MDYKALLEKYIAYVADVEGADFITDCTDRCSDIKFSAAEWEALHAAAGVPRDP